MQELANEYLERHAKRFKKSWKEDERVINRELFPTLKHRKVKELTRRDVRELVEAIADRGAPIMANRTLAVIRKMLNFAVEREWIEANPAALLKKPGAEHSRDRVLTDSEVRVLWRGFDTLPPTMASAFKVRLLSSQRGGEVHGMRWENVDLKKAWWEIPGKDTKNGEPHRLPLSTPALRVLKEQRARVPEQSPWVFVNRWGSGPITHRAKKAPALLAAHVGFSFRGHDLRRTCATGMAEAGISVETIARVLNHIDGSPRATKVYNRYSYDAEKRQALDVWAKRLMAILKEKKAGR